MSAGIDTRREGKREVVLIQVDGASPEPGQALVQRLREYFGR
jgi:hypothetical protein